jgi:hypothetical protein
MRFYEASEGGMKRCIEREGEFEERSKTIEKGVL